MKYIDWKLVVLLVLVVLVAVIFARWCDSGSPPANDTPPPPVTPAAVGPEQPASIPSIFGYAGTAQVRVITVDGAEYVLFEERTIDNRFAASICPKVNQKHPTTAPSGEAK